MDNNIFELIKKYYHKDVEKVTNAYTINDNMIMLEVNGKYTIFYNNGNDIIFFGSKDISDANISIWKSIFRESKLKKLNL